MPIVYIENIEKPHPSNQRKPSIAITHPEVAASWFYTKNCGFNPNEFSAGSNVKAWWQCERDPKHIWPAAIEHRCKRNHDCPFCFGKYLQKTPVIQGRSLAHCYPEVAKEWHSKKNGSLQPKDVLAGANTKVWWKCPKNGRHSWQATIKSRTNGKGCPKCYVDTFLDLGDFPEILKLFDKKKNKFLDPHKLTNKTVVWWRCPEGPDHSWTSRFNRKSLLCKCCRNRQVSVTNSLATLYPKIAKQLHSTRNGDLTADKIIATSSIRAWWRCPLNPKHVWEATVNNRTYNESRCPECFNIRRSRNKKGSVPLPK